MQTGRRPCLSSFLNRKKVKVYAKARGSSYLGVGMNPHTAPAYAKHQMLLTCFLSLKSQQR